ncbi:MAG: TonB-dependent receptor [Acidobacteriota bacterium]
MRRLLPALLLLTTAATCAGQSPPAKQEPAQASQGENKSSRRTELNLLGETDAGAGESRRNENVQFNPIDNNALRELNIRMGTSATIVEEFRSDRGYFGVEFGSPPPAPLHVPPAPVPRLHGSLFESHNNSVFSARSFFQAGAVKPARENDYGFKLGAAPRPRTALSLEAGQQKIRGSVNGNVLVPRPDERTPLTTDPVKRAIIARFLAAFPNELPNRTDINERALNTNSPQSVDTGSAGLRLDESCGARDRVSFRYSLLAQSVDAFQFVAGQHPDTDTRSHTGRLTWARTRSAATVTEISLGFDRLRSLLAPEENAVGPTVSFGKTLEGLGPDSDLPIDRAQNLFRYAAQLHQVRGAHSWTAGTELLRRQVNGSETSSHRGNFYFRNDFGRDTITNFRLGTPSRYSVGFGPRHRGFRSWQTQFFAGDNWRLSSRLSVHYGIRYQPVTGPSEVNRLTSIPFGCECNNLAPRVGAAWRLPARWGVLRSAWGLHYGEIFPVTFQEVRFNPPGTIKMEFQVPDLVRPLGDLTPASITPDLRSTIYDLPRDLRTPYSHQYNFSWEPEFSGDWKVQLGYVGSRSGDLLMMLRNNRARVVPGIEQTTATINLRRPDSAHFDVRRIANSSQGYFDAGRVSVVLPRRRGLSVEAAYWFGKAIDLGAPHTNTAAGDASRQGHSQSEEGVAQDLKALSEFDQSHSCLVRLAYAVPPLASRGGWLRAMLAKWEISAVALAKTGTPFSVLSGSDAPGYGNVDGVSSDRPNLLDPAVLGRGIAHPETSARLLPPGAFAFIRPTDARGNLGRHTFRKDGIGNVNAAVSRSWALAGDMSLTFRAESINLLNTAQFAAPGYELTTPDFGQISNTLNDGRAFRFQLRFSF